MHDLNIRPGIVADDIKKQLKESTLYSTHKAAARDALLRCMSGVGEQVLAEFTAAAKRVVYAAVGFESDKWGDIRSIRDGSPIANRLGEEAIAVVKAQFDGWFTAFMDDNNLRKRTEDKMVEYFNRQFDYELAEAIRNELADFAQMKAKEFIKSMIENKELEPLSDEKTVP